MKTKTYLLVIGFIMLFSTSCSIFHYTPSSKIHKIEFSITDNKLEEYDFVFSDYKTNNYLNSLQAEFKLDSLVMNANTDLQKVIILLDWTHSRWEHDGNNTPKKSDAISILREAETGKTFRCVEYGIVLSSALKSIGIPARTLGLKTKDVEKTKSSAGHVVTETYLADFNKWIFLDSQMNYVPFLNNKPLSGVEFQNAIYNNREQIELRNLNKNVEKKQIMKYVKWIGKYLYYFDTAFDNRDGELKERIKYEGKSALMLVPIGAKKPTIFQRNYKLDYLIYTNSLKEFYKEPITTQ